MLNTSFNLKGEPIVTTPAEAISTFARAAWTRWCSIAGSIFKP